MFLYGNNVMSAQMLEVSLLGVGTVLCLGRDAWSMVKLLRQAANECPPPHSESGINISTIQCFPYLQTFLS